MTEDTAVLKAAKAEARTKYRDLPGVVGFGLGDNTVVIYIADPKVASLLPSEIHGVKVEIVVSGEVVAY